MNTETPSESCGLTEILAHVEQESRSSAVKLVEERAEAEEQQCGHAEAIITQGEAQPQGRQPISLSTVPISGVICKLVVV